MNESLLEKLGLFSPFLVSLCIGAIYFCNVQDEPGTLTVEPRPFWYVARSSYRWHKVAASFSAWEIAPEAVGNSWPASRKTPKSRGKWERVVTFKYRITKTSKADITLQEL